MDSFKIDGMNIKNEEGKSNYFILSIPLEYKEIKST